MNVETVSAAMRINRRDGLWLAVAVLLHSLVLLIPVRQPSGPAKTVQSVTISLFNTAEIEFSAKPAPGHAPLTKGVSPPENPLLAKKPATRKDPAVDKEEPSDLSESEAPLNTSTALLIESLSRVNWTIPDRGKKRHLGVPVPGQIPENWRAGIHLEENRFDDMVVPRKVEIIDRWLAADGSHNVVMNTTGGETLCGRAQAWNPMSPMLEPVMMFRRCGGGGKRGFKMPDHYMRESPSISGEPGGSP
jgi:hypothetical protein